MVALGDLWANPRAPGVFGGVRVRDGPGTVAQLQAERFSHVGGLAASGVVQAARRAVDEFRETLLRVAAHRGGG